MYVQKYILTSIEFLYKVFLGIRDLARLHFDDLFYIFFFINVNSIL